MGNISINVCNINFLKYGFKIIWKEKFFNCETQKMLTLSDYFFLMSELLTRCLHLPRQWSTADDVVSVVEYAGDGDEK